MVLRLGIEPRTTRVKGPPLIPLSYRSIERTTGLEPASPAWKAGTRPIDHIRRVVPGDSETPTYRVSAGRSAILSYGTMVQVQGLEPRPLAPKASALTLTRHPVILRRAGRIRTGGLPAPSQVL